ncbi:hypothetical protein [Parapedobacter indicus]|uniref:Uncharacterized protein n=1 Tax=Parapedobacter indicus TaxID=1477437 RepID=A0A1I3MB50_9SPHI|nr:hypothetical protein [Parapedobacter indicus]PPL01220.1 hypothetical protein CLV26_10628 [Parapedobacter indicus]SFI94314.1 hypothetical protein SAMN05444682_106307 [Parapedobacter indicus]
METFIPILIAIVVFAFQAYANFQKEQEKARKRNLGQPPVPPLPEENAERTLVKPETDVHRRVVAPPQRQAQPIREAYESYSGFMDADNVTRTKKAVRNPTLSSLRIDVDEGADSAYVRDEMTFDLRDAVIKSAILERPYP